MELAKQALMAADIELYSDKLFWSVASAIAAAVGEDRRELSRKFVALAAKAEAQGEDLGPDMLYDISNKLVDQFWVTSLLEEDSSD